MGSLNSKKHVFSLTSIDLIATSLEFWTIRNFLQEMQSTSLQCGQITLSHWHTLTWQNCTVATCSKLNHLPAFASAFSILATKHYKYVSREAGFQHTVTIIRLIRPEREISQSVLHRRSFFRIWCCSDRSRPQTSASLAAAGYVWVTNVTLCSGLKWFEYYQTILN